MKTIRTIIVAVFAVVTQMVDAQAVSEGFVLDGETLEAIVGATISDASTKKMLAVTDAEGRFLLPKNNDIRLKINYIGYRELVTEPTKDGRYRLQPEVRKVGEVVVTAQESRGLATASKIEKFAMEHLQPSSFADILELLPGGRAQNPVLTAPNTIRASP